VLSKALKLPARVVLQINDLLIYVRMPSQDGAAGPACQVWTDFRLAIKRRFFSRCQHMFPGASQKLKAQGKSAGGLSEAYIWNEVLEDD